MTNTKYIETYRQESEELLADIEDAILDLEQNPRDQEAINRLFRSMHTIKGSGAMFGFDDIAGFTHHLETVLDKVREGSVTITAELINLILASRDHIKSMLDTIDSGGTVDIENSGKLIAALHTLLPDAKEQYPTTVVSDKKKSPLPISRKTLEMTYRIKFRPPPDILKTGMDPALLLKEIRELGESVIVAQTDDVPPLDILDPEQCYLFWDIILITASEFNTIKDVFIFVEEDSQLTIEQIVKDASTDRDLLVPRLSEILVERGYITAEDVNRILEPYHQKIGESFVDSGVISHDKVEAALSEQRAIDRQKKKTITTSVRVLSEKLDHLINLVGELVITQAHLSQIYSNIDDLDDIRQRNPLECIEQLTGELANPVESLERLTGELRDCALSMRMLPIGTVFGRFRRLVRDLSMELGKEIDLITEGGETELDKTVIERLNDPLIHLIRNSADHGIRTPDERERNNKPRQGKIYLKAGHRGANVVINIEDDGVGMDSEAIRRKAVERGLIPADKAIEEKDIFLTVFAPGFSTADRVTKVSGRGVGLDVVKREIESLGGSVQIASKKMKGVSITLVLPLTLAIIDGLLINVGGNFFVLPLAHVDECTELSKDLINQRHGRHMIMVRDMLLPFIRLREVFHISGNAPAEEHIAIVQVENLRVGIVVDEIMGTIQTVIKSLDRNYREAEGISGATIMGDGIVALIIDIPGLVRCAEIDEVLGVKC